MRDFKEIRVAVAGTGYVGLSIATLLSQHHHVTAVDVIPEKVEKLNNKVSPIQDDYIEKYLAEKPLDLVATLDGRSAYADADFVVIAAPTNYDPVKNYFDTSRVEEVIDLVLEVNPDAVMVIKSTIPVGYTRNLYVKYAQKGVKKFNLLFSPEFLRESKALYDNLDPSRIIVGYPKIIDRPEFAEENSIYKSDTVCLVRFDVAGRKYHLFCLARSGDALQKAFTDKEELLKQQASNLHEQKKAGVIFEAEEVITLLTSVLKTSSASRTSLSSRHQFAPGATVLYKGDKMVLNLDRSRVPTECIEKIEAIPYGCIQ